MLLLAHVCWALALAVEDVVSASPLSNDDVTIEMIVHNNTIDKAMGLLCRLLLLVCLPRIPQMALPFVSVDVAAIHNRKERLC